MAVRPPMAASCPYLAGGFHYEPLFRELLVHREFIPHQRRSKSTLR
jgi:hypothetical protein